MLNIILDTNVIFSALNTPQGSCAKVLRIILAHPETFQLLYTSHIFDEYKAVLYRPKLTCRVATPIIDAMLSLLERAGAQTISQPLDWLVYPDRKDKAFIEAAIYNHALLLTCNMRVFPFADVKALFPDEFLLWCDNQELS